MDVDETQLCMLPEEMVMMIMSLLPLSDLKSMACTSSRYKYFVDRIITKRQKVFLCLNKRIGSVQQHYYRLRETLQLIEPSVVLTSQRQYQNVSMVFSREEVPWQLRRMLEMILLKNPIRKLHIVGTHPTTVLAVLEIGSLYRTITNLSVFLVPRKRRNETQVQICHTPQLQVLSWTERHSELPIRPSQTVMLVTPQLRMLRLITGYKVAPRLLSYEGPASNKMYGECANLERLVVVLNREVREALVQQVMPKLEHFECTVSTSPQPDFWPQLRTCMPNLAYLKVRSIHDVWTSKTFAGCDKLRTLVMLGGRMEFASGSLFEVSNLRHLCLLHCRLPPEPGTLKFSELESLCFVASHRRETALPQDWHLPRLRYLCIEAPGFIGINLRSCPNLEYCRLIIKAPMQLLPTQQMVLNNLTTLQLECRFPGCQDMLPQLLARAKNLKNLWLLTRGCCLHWLLDLPSWCPQLRSLTIMASWRPLVLSHDILRAIFLLPAVEEIILGTMTVVGVETPIVIPRQLRILIVQVLFCEAGEVPVFTIDPDHPAAENIVIRPCYGATFRYYTVNDDTRQSHMRSVNRATPFQCNHVKYSFNSWLAPHIDAEDEIKELATYH